MVEVEKGENEVSKVIHVHSERELNTRDIITYLSKFGEVAYVFNMKTPNQMLVEMKEEENAQEIVELHSKEPAQMNNTRVYFQFSRSKRISRNTNLDHGYKIFVFFIFFKKKQIRGNLQFYY
jgi:hypothetical protein